MKKKISPVLIVLALAAVFLAGLIFILLVGPSKPNGFIEGKVVDAQTGEAVPGVDVMAVDSAGISYDKRENMECQKDRHVDELDGEIGPLMRSASVDNGKRTVIRFSVTAPGKKATGFCQSVHQRC